MLMGGAGDARAAMSRGFNRLLESVVSINVRELAFESGARRYTSSLGSGVLMSAAWAEGLVDLAPEQVVQAGDQVAWWPYSECLQPAPGA